MNRAGFFGRSCATRTVFMENLNSPFGIVLVGNELFIANADGSNERTVGGTDWDAAGVGDQAALGRVSGASSLRQRVSP